MNAYPRLCSLFLATAALSAPLLAQGPFSGLVPMATFPSDHAPDLTAKTLQDGFSLSANIPLSSGKARHLILYESADLPMPHGRAITHVGFQAEAGRKSVGHDLLMKIFMGKSRETAKSMKNNFAANFSSPPVQVFGGATGGVVSLPNLGDSLSPNPDRPFVWIQLDVPYTFDSTENLLIDYQVLGNRNSNNAFTYYLDVGGLLAPVQSAGQGCVDSSNTIPTLKSRPSGVGGNWILDLSTAPASSNAILTVSLRATMIPSFNGRGDCTLYPDPALMIPALFAGRTNSTGRNTWIFPVPDDIAFNDLTLISQVLVSDFFARGGFTLSNGDDIELGMSPRMTVLRFVGDPASAVTGSPLRNYGLISHFRYQ